MIDDSWYIRPTDVPESDAAGGVVVRWDGAQVLLALAKERDYTNYVLPKGHVDPGEAVEEAARREIEEEVGVSDLEFVEKIGVKERLDFNKTEWKTTHYFLYRTEQIEAVPTDVRQHDQMYWVPHDPLPVFFWPEQRALVEENAFRIRGAVARKG